MNNTKARSTRPLKIFLQHQIIVKDGLLDAIIIGELFYWIAKQESPWRNAGDYSAWLMTNPDTILSKFKSICETNQYLRRDRTRMKNGYLGAYKFNANKTQDSKTLKEIYSSILNNSNINIDYGEFNPDEPSYKEIPESQLIVLDTIDLVGCYKQAYILDRISWALVSRCADNLYFRSKQHFDDWCGLGTKTGQRLLAKLTAKGFAFGKSANNQFVVYADKDTSSYQFFSEYMCDKQQTRKASISEMFD
ncbi:hypothetical protein ACOI22_03655 [Glaciecola sp. 2405UD65-10]|uniref:hypothetical protein n=1 Tax=Glaciecola sp. 2405UD65-10 TaxID=3397244 RepID=UPI003B5CC9AB